MSVAVAARLAGRLVLVGMCPMPTLQRRSACGRGQRPVAGVLCRRNRSPGASTPCEADVVNLPARLSQERVAWKMHYLVCCLCDTRAMPADAFNPSLHPRRPDGKFKGVPAPAIPQSKRVMSIERPPAQAGAIGDPLTSAEEADLCARVLSALDREGRTLEDALEGVSEAGARWTIAHFELACRDLCGETAQEAHLVNEPSAEAAAAKINAAVAQVTADAKMPLQGAILRRCADDLCKAAESGRLSRDKEQHIIKLAAWRFVCDNDFIHSDVIGGIIGQDTTIEQAREVLEEKRVDALTRVNAEPW